MGALALVARVLLRRRRSCAVRVRMAAAHSGSRNAAVPRMGGLAGARARSHSRASASPNVGPVTSSRYMHDAPMRHKAWFGWRDAPRRSAPARAADLDIASPNDSRRAGSSSSLAAASANPNGLRPAYHIPYPPRAAMVCYGMLWYAMVCCKLLRPTSSTGAAAGAATGPAASTA